MADSSTNIPQLYFGQANKEVTVNELFAAVSPAMLFGRNGVTSAGLDFGLLGGRWNGLPFANVVLTLPDNATIYLSIDLATRVFSSESGGFKAGEMPLYKVTTSGGLVTDYEDHRAAYGIGIPEAPTDGKQYARKDAGWAEVATSYGDMEAATYDPQGIEADAFDRANHTGTQPMASIDFIQAGTGAVQRTAQNKMQETVSVLDFGADPTATTDSSAAITLALASASHVVVPPGTYRCDSMIELNGGKTLELMGGVTLRRYSAYSASTDPVVWIKNSSASFFGAGQASSTVKTENRAPKGVVRLGHKDMTQSHANVDYCSLQNMSIIGAIGYGQTTGEPDIALYMPNPQFGNLTSYFHNIFGLRVMDANIGIYLHGSANANTISNIQGYRLGNTTLGTDKNVFIVCHGALHNAVSNCFFNDSENSVGLLVNNFDNTANGGTTHNIFANSWSGMVFQQGGASAYGLKSLIASGRSYYGVVANVALGNSTPAGFYDNNIYVSATSGNISASSIYIGAVDSQGAVTAATTVSGATVESAGELKALGSVRTGASGAYCVAKRVKRNATTNAATVSFTLSHTAQASLWRYGYVRITVAGGDGGAASSPVAWFLYRAASLNTAYPSVGILKDSGGDTASFTITDAGSGVITVSSTQDSIICELEYGFTTTNVNVT